MKNFLCLLLVIFPFAAQAADADCKDQTTVGQSSCAQADFNKADAELNKLYLQLLPKLVAMDKAENVEKGERGYVQSLKNSQRAWILYRDGECDLQTIDAVGGTLRQITYPTCKASMTEERSKELKQILKCVDEGLGECSF